MANDTMYQQSRGIISTIYNLLFGPTKSQDVKQLRQNVSILMQNQNLQQSFIETTVQANNVTYIHLEENGHMTHILIDALKSINYLTHKNNMVINSLNYARNFLLASTEIEHILKQLQNKKNMCANNKYTPQIGSICHTCQLLHLHI